MFYKEFRKIIQKSLEQRNTVESLISKVKELSINKPGKIAFFPCGRLTADILKEIKENSPELVPKVLGCFDESDSATTESGFEIFQIDKLEELKDDISTLIIASNTFYSKEMKKLDGIEKDNMEILNISFFETSFPLGIDDNDIMKKIDLVYNLLSDKKSRAVYMVAWLSRMMNNEDLTYLFESEEKLNIDIEPIQYKEYVIHGIDRECKRELFSELYKMKHVFPEHGDIVFDIGAYKGDTSIFFAHHIKDEGTVFAFEPIKANYDCILENVKINSLDNIVEPVNLGVSNESGMLKGVSSESGAPWSYLGEERGDLDVEVTSVDDFVTSKNLSGIDFIKMDVEGLEHDVISGSKNTIRKFNPKLAIAIYHFTSDLITLPLELNQLGDYNFFLRAKVEGPFGFTLYAKKRN